MKGKLVVLVILTALAISTNSFGEGVKLMFPEMKEKDEKPAQARVQYYLVNAEDGKTAGYIEKSVKELKEMFQDDYRVVRIELWIEAAAENDGVTKLFVSPEGKAGCKVTLEFD